MTPRSFYRPTNDTPRENPRPLPVPPRRRERSRLLRLALRAEAVIARTLRVA